MKQLKIKRFKIGNAHTILLIKTFSMLKIEFLKNIWLRIFLLPYETNKSMKTQTLTQTRVSFLPINLSKQFFS